MDIVAVFQHFKQTICGFGLLQLVFELEGRGKGLLLNLFFDGLI